MLPSLFPHKFCVFLGSEGHTNGLVVPLRVGFSVCIWPWSGPLPTRQLVRGHAPVCQTITVVHVSGTVRLPQKAVEIAPTIIVGGSDSNR